MTTALAASGQRFAFLSDIHITPGNKSVAPLREAVREINATPLDFVILAGDLTNEGSDEELVYVKSILDSISHPLYVIPGNHETTWSQSAARTFTDLWGNDRFVAEYDSLIIIGIGCGPYMKMGDGHIKTEDLIWLKETLDSRMAPGKKVLSINHYPLKDDLDNCGEYVDALAGYPVVVHLGGHYHRWIEYNVYDDPEALPGVMLRALDMKNGDYGYSLVEIDPEWIHIYNKPVGKPREAKFALPVKTTYKTVAHAAPEWTVPEGFEIEQVWSDPASIFTRVSTDDENVYFGTSTGNIKAVTKTAPHREAWTMQTGGSVYARPNVLKNGRIAFPTTDGITVTDKKGRVVNVFPSADGPYVADGLVDDRGWTQGGYKRLEYRNPKSGKVVWTYDSIFNYCQGAPTVAGDDIIFGAWDTNLRCVDRLTGHLRWVWNNGKPNNQLGPGNVVPVVTDDYVFIVAPDRYMTAIDRRTGKTVWRDNSHRYRESIGHSEDMKTVFAKTMDGELVAVDASAPVFTELWTLDLGLGYEHAPCIVLEKDGVVYVGSRRGIVTAVDAAGHSIIWQLQLGTGEINGFDVDPLTGDIYTSLIDGKVYRILRL